MTITKEFREMLSLTSASILSASPVVATAYDLDFEKNLAVFSEFANANKGVTILLQIGFEHETPEPATRLAAAISRFRELSPDSRIIVLCNCEGEVSALGALGVETRLVNQNCFIDEGRLRPMGGEDRPYDAVYVARLTPFKRHSLIPDDVVPRLLLLGCKTDELEINHPKYVKKEKEHLADAEWVESFPGAKLPELLAKAKCGLILSAAEGACFASSEYLLCGLPIVDTPALGGRSAMYPEEYVREVASTPEAVGDGIAYWCEHRPDPWKVRAAWLAKAAPHRAAFRELMRELTGRTPRRIPHKLGLRTPHSGALWSLAVRAYLFAKGMTV